MTTKAERKAAAAELVKRRLARKDFAAFMRFVFKVVDPGTELKWGWYLDALCEYAMHVYNGDLQHLIVNIPPRTLKSIVFSVGLPAWVLGQKPTEQFLCASGASSLATELSTNSRRVIMHPWYRKVFPETELTKDQDTKNFFKTTQQGHRFSTSTNTKLIGFGGNWQILDDPNQPEDAFRPEELVKANRWYDLTFSERANDINTVKRIAIQQRLATNDMTAHLEELGWFKLVLPRLFELRTTYHLPISKKEIVMEAGETLHPERVGLEKVEEMKKNKFKWASQQQQKPVAVGGNRIKDEWFRRYTTIDAAYDEVVQSWDTANKGNELANKSVCLTFGRIGDVWRLIDRWAESAAYPILKRRAFALEAEHKPNFILIEDKASGQQLIQEMQEKNKPIVAIQPKGSKDSRMSMEIETGGLENGLIALPDGVQNCPPWLNEFERRIQEFPNPLEWDDIDAFSQFLKWVRAESGNRVESW